MTEYKPKENAVKFTSALVIDRNSSEYRLGVAQLKEWHARCRAKRPGIKRDPKAVMTRNAIRKDRMRGDWE